jgi:glycosyltransferase involved in cell wall biosynthesis
MQNKITNAKIKSLSQANKLVRDKKYEEALVLYELALSLYPSLHKVIIPNIDYTKRKISKVGSKIAHKAKLECPSTLDKYFFEIIEESGLFDPVWYLAEYGEKYKIEENPLAHYLDFGVKNGLNPSPQFDTSYYLKSNPDIASAGINPFIHYTSQGCKENRSPLPPLQPDFEFNYPIETPRYVQRLAPDAPLVEKSVRVIAFYLPQFHPIAENDAWWGKGFTEWTNVRPAKPLFEGHYQPHVPDDYLGYYDLSDTSIMHKQIELAKQYGIEGFCFYTYWFTGHRLLETPVDNYLSDASLDHPFCICWANENWSRRWDGLDQDLLMVQRYSDEDDLAFISHMSKYLRDPRYIRVEGKPLLIIYRPNLFPSMKETAWRWRDWCRNNGLGEIYLAYVQSFEKHDPADYGLDVAIEFPPNNSTPPDITENTVPLFTEFSGKVYDWRVFLQRSENFDPPTYPLFRGVCPSWDNTARKKERGIIFANSSPNLFQRWLVSAFEDTRHRVAEFDKSLVFINAWNEWAEGAHLEPDQRYGYAWLDAVREAHATVSRRQQKVLVVSHDAHPHGAQYLILEVARILQKMNFDISILLLDGGKLQGDFETIAQTLNAKSAGEDAVRAFLSRLHRQGAQIAITSTVVCGSAIPLLKEYGYRVISLIHELPGVIRQMQQESNALMIAQHTDKLVFPAPLVFERFTEIIPVEPSKVVIRPQGLLRSNPFKNRKEEALHLICEKHHLPIGTRIVLNIAYADVRKGADLFIEIAAATLKIRFDTAFIWVGHHEQSMKSHIKQRIQELKLQDRIMFIGFDKEPMAYYAAASVFALTSREDPFPNVVLESTEVGVPVIAFEGASGAGDFIVAQGGCLVPYMDTNAYSRQLCALLDTPSNASCSSVGSLQRYVSDLLFHIDSRQRVSVIVPNYNYAKHIIERLITVCSQTHAIYELIVLDDKSTDESVSLINEFLSGLSIDSRLVVNESNSGSVFKQWKRGLELSSGDLVWIAEADDLCEPEMLQELVQAFNDPSVVLAYCQSKQIDENGNVLAESYLDYTADVSDKWQDDYLIDGLEEICSSLSIKNTIPNVSAVVFRRSSLLAAMERIGDKLINYRVAGDWLVYLHVLSQGKIYYRSKSLNKHRRHLISVTTSTAVGNHFNEVLEMQKIAMDMATPPPEIVAKIKAYIMKLEKHFGLS